MIGETFCDNRFICTNVSFSLSEWIFQFLDNENKIKRYLSVEINRMGHWNSIDKKTYYNLKYPNIPASHQISADWFADIDNARLTFEEALKCI